MNLSSFSFRLPRPEYLPVSALRGVDTPDRYGESELGSQRKTLEIYPRRVLKVSGLRILSRSVRYQQSWCEAQSVGITALEAARRVIEFRVRDDLPERQCLTAPLKIYE